MSGSLLILGLFGRGIFLFVWLRGRIWRVVLSFVLNDFNVLVVFQLRAGKVMGRWNGQLNSTEGITCDVILEIDIMTLLNFERSNCSVNALGKGSN